MLALIEADSGLRLADLSASEQFGPKLTHRLRRSQGDTATAYIVSLTHDLVSLGYAEQAGLIAYWYLRGYDNLWHVPDNGDPGVTHVIPLVGLWLELRSAGQPDFAWRLSGQAVVYLRRSLLVEDLQLADRREFIGYVEGLRGQIKRVGYSWTTPGASSRADQERMLQAQLWDAELGQRALFEEFLLTSAEPVAPGSPPQDRWPYAGDEPVSEGPPEFLQASPEDLFRLLSEEYPAPAPAQDADADDAASYAADWTKEAWLRDAEQIVRQGVTEELLAETLGRGAMLVRAGFRPGDGALVWASLRAGDDGRVQARCRARPIASPGTRIGIQCLLKVRRPGRLAVTNALISADNAGTTSARYALDHETLLQSVIACVGYLKWLAGIAPDLSDPLARSRQLPRHLENWRLRLDEDAERIAATADTPFSKRSYRFSWTLGRQTSGQGTRTLVLPPR